MFNGGMFRSYSNYFVPKCYQVEEQATVRNLIYRSKIIMKKWTLRYFIISLKTIEFCSTSWQIDLRTDAFIGM